MKKVFLDQFARLGKALSSSSRLELLDLLCQSEKTVEVLVAQSGMSLKNVSAQLRVLRDGGLVKSRKEGKYVYYSVNNEKVPQLWVSLQQFATQNFSELQMITQKFVGDLDLAIKVNRRELLARAKKEEVLVIDVRPKDEYDAAHIPFAISVPLDELKSKLKKLPMSKEIVAYCRGPYCLMAADAVRLLQKNGYQASRMDAGLQEWKNEGLEITTVKSG